MSDSISNPDATRGSEDSRDDDMSRQRGMVGNRLDGRREEGNAMGHNGATSIRLIMEIKSGERRAPSTINARKAW